MKKLMFAAAAMAAGIAVADVTSANIVGYQNVEVISGYSLFTVTFKDIGTTTFDLKTLKPSYKGDDITGKATVRIYVLGSGGDYGTAIGWYGDKKIWSRDGNTPIGDNEVVLGNGKGIAVYNNVKVDKSDKESSRGTTPVAIDFQVSGEVDFVCQNIAPVGYSINGNSTPVEISLKSIVPQYKDAEITGKATVRAYLLNAGGDYGTAIGWYGDKKIWSHDGSTEIDDAEAKLVPGRGFAIYNNVKVDKTDKESSRGTTPVAITLNVPAPIPAE